MMNIIRADIYRITRGKTLFVTFAIVALLSAAVVIASGIGLDEMPVLEGSIMVQTSVEAQQSLEFNGMNAMAALFAMSSFNIMFLIPLFAVVAGHVFQEGTAKNEVTWGTSRTKIYLARAVTVAVLCVMVLIAFIGVGTAIATAMRGFGEVPDGWFLSYFLAPFTAQSFMFISSGLFGIFVVFMVKGSVVTVELFCLGMFGAGFITMIFAVSGTDVSPILRVDMLHQIALLANVAHMETNDIIMALGLGAVWLIVPMVIGIYKFKTAEIK